MVVADGRGIPLATLVDSAQKAEVNLAEPTLNRIRVPRKRGRPRKRPKSLVADKGYDSRGFRQRLRRRGIRPCIPERRGKRPRRGRKPDLSDYRHRWIVERTVAWLGNFRRLVVRYERLTSVYHGFLTIACLIVALRTILQ
jgi:transposase